MAATDFGRYDFNAPTFYDFTRESAYDGAAPHFNKDAKMPPEKAHNDPWIFDAPTWSDLSQDKAPASIPVRKPAVIASAMTKLKSTADQLQSSASVRQVSVLRSAPEAPSNLVISMEQDLSAPPAAAAPVQKVIQTSNTFARDAVKQAGPAAAATASIRPVPSARRAAIPPSKSPPISRRPMAVPPPAADDRPRIGAIASPAASRTLQSAESGTTAKSKPCGQTFVDRPRKVAAGFQGNLAVPSYLSHTAAGGRKQPVINELASFLRPTNSSWARLQTGETAVTAATAKHRNAQAGETGAAVTPRGGVRSATTERRGRVELTEERQMREAQEARVMQRKQRLENQANHERNRNAGSIMTAPLRSTKPLTIPCSPALASGRCGRQAAIELHQSHVKPKASMHIGPKPLTVPKAPALHTDARLRKHREDGGVHVPPPPPARQAHNAVPPPPPALQPIGNGALTIPHSPCLTTDRRARAREGTCRDPKSTELSQRAKDQIECHRQFKALPLDPRVMQSNGDIGLPKLAKHDLTQPEPFHFATAARTRGPLSAESESQDFEADHCSQPANATKGQPAPPGAPTVAEPRPFALETARRGHLHKMMFEQRLRQEREQEQEAREIHAQPAPRLNHTFQTRPSAKPLTEFKEFDLQGQKRHELYEVEQAEKLRREREDEMRMAQVKARPLPASTAFKAFDPKPSDREPLIPLPSNLHSDQRAAERKLFDAQNEERQARIKAESMAIAAEDKYREEIEIQELRRMSADRGGMQFRARKTLVVQQPMLPKPSVHQLTNPTSPQLETKKRALTRPYSSLRPPTDFRAQLGKPKDKK